MTEKQLLARLQGSAPGFIRMLGGRFIAADPTAKTCIIEFDISRDFCHSIDVVQGGFITAMLDMTMSHAVFAMAEDVVDVATLEIKTTYLEPSRAGRLRAEACVIKSGYKIAFMEARLYNPEGILTATASTVAKLARRQ